MPQIIFIERSGGETACEFLPGDTVLTVAKRYNMDMEGACEGAMACSTCHVIVDNDWYGKLSTPSIEENDLLDLAPGVTSNSRLACQITLTSELDGLKVELT